MSWPAVVVAAALVAALRYAAVRAMFKQQLSPDGLQYLAMGRNEAAERPFHLRWQLPFLLGDHQRRWRWATGAALILTGPALGLFLLAAGCTLRQAIAGAALYVGLPGVFDTCAILPVLTDAWAHLLTILAAGATVAGYYNEAVLLALVAGMNRETAPIWAAVLAWHPAPLLGLFAPAMAWALLNAKPRADINRLGNAIRFHAHHWLDGRALLLPWGACLAALWAPTPQVLVALGLGYGCLLLANDTARIYQQGAAVVVLGAVSVIPADWLLPTCVGHWFVAAFCPRRA